MIEPFYDQSQLYIIVLYRKSRNEDSVKHLLGTFPEENLSRKLDTYISQQSREVRQSQGKLQQLRSEMARLEADRKNCQ